jgi:hypothetical protein
MPKFMANQQVVIDELPLDNTKGSDGRMRAVTVFYSGWESSAPPNFITGSQFAAVFNVEHNPRTRSSHFQVAAIEGKTGIAYVYDENTKADVGLRLVVGKVKNFRDWPHDLVAQLLGRSSDAVRLSVYKRILELDNNNSSITWDDWDKLLANPLKQTFTAKKDQRRWDCGASANRFGQSYFGPLHFLSANSPYYTPFPSNVSTARRSDLKFEASRMRRGLEKIRTLISNEVAITVFATHSDGMSVSGGVVQQRNSTHFLTVVGMNQDGTEFLVTDPWPGGSKTLYDGGIYPGRESILWVQ